VPNIPRIAFLWDDIYTATFRRKSKERIDARDSRKTKTPAVHLSAPQALNMIGGSF
jgi:hypothetical protein